MMSTIPMTRRNQMLLALYLALLIALAALGATHQERHRYHVSLLENKRALQYELSDLRQDAAQVKGPLAVRRWALSQGMISVPEGAEATHIAPAPAPEPEALERGLEVRTIWR